MATTSLLVALLTLGVGAVGQVKLGEPAPDPAKVRAAAIERAKTYLAEALEVPAKELTVESAKETTWADASLGCPEKGRMYAQVVTSGWTVVLKAKGQTHEVHVAGKRAVTCRAAQATGDKGRDR
jgi:hypothetical protein